MNTTPKTAFVPMLVIPHGTMDLEFYKNGFGAIEINKVTNDDGSIHVSEMTIDGILFHFHEEVDQRGTFGPEKYKGVTTIIGLMVADVDKVMNRAIGAGALITSHAQDYDYGYRQGEIVDLLGHHWLIEKVI